MSDQIIDIVDVGIPGETGDVTEAALQAVIDAEAARDQAEVYSATTQVLQDSAVSALIDDDNSGTRQKLTENYVPWTDGQIDINGGWGKPYDTDVWIAGPTRIDPTLSSQGLYIQHRVSGNLGGLVNDAGASELRLNNATNTGAGQAAHENSLVLTGGVNDINLLVGVLANFHTSGTPTGSIQKISLLKATQAPPLPSGLTVQRAVTLELDSQIIGEENWTIRAPNGDSSLGIIKSDTDSRIALNVRGREAQTGRLVSVERADGIPFLVVGADGNMSVGPLDDAARLSVRGGDGGSPVLSIRPSASQTVDILRVKNAANEKVLAVGSTGNVHVVGTSLLVRNTTDTGTVYSLTPAGIRWNEASLTQTTVGGAGGAAALPATPKRYLRVIDSDGTVLVIPAYNRA